jgi:hypothetical protein
MKSIKNKNQNQKTNKELDSLVTDLFVKEIGVIEVLRALLDDFSVLNWRYFWFYRYLRISPSYNYLLKLIDYYLDKKKITRVPNKNNYSDQIKVQELKRIAFKDFQKNIPLLFETYRLNGDLRTKSLAEWWFCSAADIFDVDSVSKRPYISTIEYIRANEKYYPKKIEIAKKRLEGYLKGSTRYRGPAILIIGLKVDTSKERILKYLEKHIDEHVEYYTQPSLSAGALVIKKTKHHEKKFIDSYQALFTSICYPELTNEQLAEKSGVLNISQKATDSGSRSLQSGFSRLTREAVCIAENAAYGIFPEDDNTHMHKLVSYNSEYLNKQTFLDVYEQVNFEAGFENKIPDYQDVVETKWERNVLN